MVKLECRPTSSAWLRSIFAATEWKVPSQGIPSSAPPDNAPTRSRMPRAALLVNVTAKNLAWPGSAGRNEMREPRRQCSRLAGARTRQNKYRPICRQHSFALGRVQPAQIGRFRGWGRELGHNSEVGGGERNGNRGGCTSCDSGVCDKGPTVVPEIPVIHRLVTKNFASATREQRAWCSSDRGGRPSLFGGASLLRRGRAEEPISAGRQLRRTFGFFSGPAGKRRRKRKLPLARRGS